MYADYQTSKKGRAKKNDDKIFNREDDITDDKNAILKKIGGSPKDSSSESDF